MNFVKHVRIVSICRMEYRNFWTEGFSATIHVGSDDYAIGGTTYVEFGNSRQEALQNVIAKVRQARIERMHAKKAAFNAQKHFCKMYRKSER